MPHKIKINEHDLQSACVRFFRVKYRKQAGLLFSIPNGAKLAGTGLQRAKAWKRLEAEGARAGVADLFLSVPSGDLAGLYIEMKTAKGVQSPEQKAFEQDVLEAGYGYAMPRSFDEFCAVVENYLNKGFY